MTVEYRARVATILWLASSCFDASGGEAAHLTGMVPIRHSMFVHQFEIGLVSGDSLHLELSSSGGDGRIIAHEVEVRGPLPPPPGAEVVARMRHVAGARFAVLSGLPATADQSALIGWGVVREGTIRAPSWHRDLERVVSRLQEHRLPSPDEDGSCDDARFAVVLEDSVGSVCVLVDLTCNSMTLFDETHGFSTIYGGTFVHDRALVARLIAFGDSRASRRPAATR